MKHIKLFESYINEALSNKIKNQVISKFKKENPDITDVQIDYYLNRFEELKNSPKIVKKDILQYTFAELEKVIDQIPVKSTIPKSTNNEYDPSDIVYDENGLIILKGDTREKCVRYGRGYTWCISRSDSSNMFNTYRFRYDEINFYFIFDKELPKTDPNHALVLLVDKSGRYFLANSDNSGDFAGSKEFDWSTIIKFQPKLTELKSLFKPLPLTPQEKTLYRIIKIQVYGPLYHELKTYDMVEKYIAFGHYLTDEQYLELDDTLKHKYINLGHLLSDEMLKNTNVKSIERYHDLHSLQQWLDQKYSKEEQVNLRVLNCNGCKLTTLKGIENLTNLMELCCYSNKLTTLEGIKKLTKLKWLYCDHNQLTSLKGIENLTNLTHLNCSSNKLTSLTEIKNLINLISLKSDRGDLDIPYGLSTKEVRKYLHAFIVMKGGPL